MDKFTPTGTKLKQSRPLLRWVSNLCLIAGVVALTISSFFWAMAHFFQAYARRHFALEAKVSEPRGQSGYVTPFPEKITNTGQPLKNNSLIGKLGIDRLGISVMVLEGVEDSTLRIAAGHVPDTSLPGHSGNVAIAAHRDTFFRALRNIRNGDEITLETPTGLYQYQVEKTWIVQPEKVEVLNPTPYPALTLITCYPFYFVGNAPDRFIVRARQIIPQMDSGNMSKDVGG